MRCSIGLDEGCESVVVAIMQPTYLPWMGYFDLIDQSDVFIFHDTVAFNRQSWQQRNRILTKTGARWLSVPVRHAAVGTPICEIGIDNTHPWRRKHWAQLTENYRRRPFWDQYSPALAEVYTREWASLEELNVALITLLAEQLGIATRFERTASMPRSPRRKEGALVDLCLEVGATTYLSPPGSFSYLQSDAEFLPHGIGVVFQQFEHPVYPQEGGRFVPYLSVVDLLMNTGPAAAAVMRSGRRQNRTVEEMRAE